MAQLKLRVRIVHLGQEINLTLASEAQGNQIIKALLNNPKLKLAKLDAEGTPVEYRLTSKKTGKIIDKKTLEESNIQEGDLLLVHQEIIAG